MRSEYFGALKAEAPEFYNKYYTPDGELRWDVVIQNLQPATPEFQKHRENAIRWFEEKERREKEEQERVERERRERENGGNSAQTGPPDNNNPS